MTTTHNGAQDRVYEALRGGQRHVADIMRETGGSSYGVAWRGPKTARHRTPNVTDVAGLYCVGASAHPGAGVPFVVWGAALVADAIGKA